MKRKLISELSAVVLEVSAISPVTPALADETNPTVILDGRDVYFEDQKPVIVDGRTLVPARAVFEAMGATVVWTEATKTVYIRSSDNLKRIYLTIDSDTMKVDTIVGVSLIASDDDIEEELITLDVPAQIINDRTMVPLRAISEALDCTVEWDGDAYEITITTESTAAATATATPAATTDTSTDTGTDTDTDAEATATPAASTDTSSSTATDATESDLPTMYITTDKTTAAADEEVTVYVNVKNVPFDLGNTISTVTATVYYDDEIFEFVDMTVYSNGEAVDSADMVSGTNASFKDDSVKGLFSLLDESAGSTEDGVVIAYTFKSIAGETGTFQLSSRRVQLSNGAYSSDTFFGLSTDVAGSPIGFKTSDELYIDRTVITINE